MTTPKIPDSSSANPPIKVEPFNPLGEAPPGVSAGERNPVGKILEILMVPDPKERQRLLDERSRIRRQEMEAYLDQKFPW